MNSNVQIYVNLMIDDEEHQNKHHYVPGDYIVKLYPDFTHPSRIRLSLTKKQLQEYYKYLTCSICGRTCAGTCISESRKWNLFRIIDEQSNIRISGDIEIQLKYLWRYVKSPDFNIKNENDYIIKCGLGIALYNTDKTENLKEAKRIFLELISENNISKYIKQEDIFCGDDILFNEILS